MQTHLLCYASENHRKPDTCRIFCTTRRFHKTRHPGCSSWYQPDPAIINLFTSIGTEAELNGNFRVLDTERVETRRLDDIEECPEPDLLKLDIQGAELDVLKNGREKLTNAVVIESEVEFIPIYKNQPLFGDLQVFLRDCGFVLHKLIDVGGRGIRPMHRGQTPFAAISQLLWADAVFVRDFTKLELYGEAELIKAAIILHHVYFSYDLVMHLLRELDRRQNGDAERAYLSALGQAKDLPLLYMNPKEHG